MGKLTFDSEQIAWRGGQTDELMREIVARVEREADRKFNREMNARFSPAEDEEAQ